MIKKFVRKFFQFNEAYLNEIAGQFRSSAYKYNFTHADFTRLAGLTYNRSSDYREAISKVSTTCADLPVCLKNMDKEKVDMPPELKKFLNAPLSDESTWEEFINRFMIQYWIAGEMFLYDLQTPTWSSNRNRKGLPNLFIARPDDIIKIGVKDGIPVHYNISLQFYKRNGIDQLMGDDGHPIDMANSMSEFKNGFLYNRISFFKTTNPISNNHRGLSPVVAMIDDVEILLKGRRWNRTVLQNEGRPSGVLFYPPNSSKALNTGANFVGKDKIEEDITNKFSGSENAGKLLFLKGGLQFKEVSYKMKDIDFLAGLRFSRETIANYFGIPLQMFGSQEKSTYNNVTEARQTFHNDTCIPLMNQILSFMCKNILSPYGLIPEGHMLSIDQDATDVANKLRIEKMKSLESVTFLTPNEKRVNCGYEKTEDENADKLLISNSLTPIDELGLGEDNIDTGDEDEENETDDEDKEKTKSESKEESP